MLILSKKRVLNFQHTSPNTERPLTITQGTNKLLSLDMLEAEFNNLLNGRRPEGNIPEFLDGKTGERIVEILFDPSSSVSNSEI